RYPQVDLLKRRDVDLLGHRRELGGTVTGRGGCSRRRSRYLLLRGLSRALRTAGAGRLVLLGSLDGVTLARFPGGRRRVAVEHRLDIQAGKERFTLLHREAGLQLAPRLSRIPGQLRRRLHADLPP